MRRIAEFVHWLIRARRRIKMIFLRPLFKAYGKNFVFDPDGLYTFETISVGNDVYIGPGAKLCASESSIILGNKIMLGPNVVMMGGDHNSTQVGRFMYDVKEKLPENDVPIQIGDDVWIGSNAIILKGVQIGMGSIVAAGSLVTKNVPEFSIVAGIPARVLRRRFSEEDIVKHKKKLNLQ